MRQWLRANGLPALIGGLFLASLGTLVATGARVFSLPQAELEARDQLRAAAAELATAAEPLAADLPHELGPDHSLPDDYDRRLGAVSAVALARHPDAEGGFSVNGRADQFAGYVHPGAAPGKGVGRRDPPPLETPSIRQQAKEALVAAPDDPPLVEVRDVGPSRVAVATAAVGRPRPARVAAWVMVLLIYPARQREQLRGYLLAAAFALGGIVLALGLTLQLGRSLRRARATERQLADELRKAEHLASLGQLLAGVAHEVRNPLAAIRSTVQLWERLPDQARNPRR